MQDTQALKTEITTALDVLSQDSLRLLAEFVAFLRTKREQNGAQSEVIPVEFSTRVEEHRKPVRVVSPRLVHREQAADFKMEVIVEPDHATV